MPAAPLPPVLEEKFAGLAAEVRRLLVARGSAWVALAGFAGLVAALGLDSALALAGWARGLLLVGWLALVGGLVWRGVVHPLRRTVSPAELAVLVERYFPGLSERLTTLVELHEHADPGNGSRALIGVLAKETDQRTRRLNFSRVAPSGATVGVGVVAILAGVAVLASLFVVPSAGERLRRFALPWYTPPVDVPFRIVVSSGDPVVRRGEPVTLSAYLAPTRPDVALPASATLLVRTKDSGDEKRLPMTEGATAAFHLTRPAVAQDFEYRVEAGPGKSDWHTVAVADPVTLAEGSSVTVRPPRYADGLVPVQTLPGFAEFDALQFGTASLALKFSGPPTEAYLQWKPAEGAPLNVPVRLEPDRLSGTADVPLTSDGTLTLVLVGDRGLRAELPAAVRATPDAPPRFEKVIGLTASARDARPDDRIPIDLAAQDDLFVEGVVVEYSATGNDADVKAEAVKLAGVGTRRAEGAFTFSLAGKAKDGQTLHYRVRVRDNRSVPDRKLGPQETVFPPAGWATLRVTEFAKPLAEQEILTQRDKVRDRLAAATKLVREAAQNVQAVRDEAPGDGSLTIDQAVRLRGAREKADDAAKQLAALAGEADLTPELRPLAGDVRDVADNLLRPAEAAVRTAEADATKAGRDKAMTTAGGKLAEALARLEELDARNEKTARARLDQNALRQIAEDERALADDAAKPDAAADELAKRQRELLARLNEAVAGSDLLKGATEAATADEMRDLLARARKLADDQKALNDAADRTDRAARRDRTADLARKQRDLAERAAKLAERTGTAARLSGTGPAERAPFDRAADKLAEGAALDAVTEQEKAARELDRLAEALARAAAARGDRREAARQVARWQDDLRRRHADAAKQPLTDDARKRFADEQAAIRDATELLRQPHAEPDLARTEGEARLTTKAAADALAGKDDAADALKKAADALAKLADKMPTAEQRAKAARAQLDHLRKEQDAIGRDADEAVRAVEKDATGAKLDAAAKRQDALAKKVRELDVPGLEVRREGTAAAADRAATDLRAGLAQDIPASQQDTRRQLDRLRQALDGVTPADELADELAREQKHISDASAKLPPNPTDDDIRELQRLQRDVNRKLGGLTAPEAGALPDAKDAAQAAEQALKRPDQPDELRKKSKAAADALAKLADQLGGAESDQTRAERLARDRADQAKQSKQAAEQSANPEASADALRKAQRQADELEQLRAGKAQAAKKRAAEALQKLTQAKEPDRRPTLQQDAADALRRLADEMARNGDRTAPTKGSARPQPGDADALRKLTGNGNLPGDPDADAARELAREQRALRDAASQAAAASAKGVTPADKDALGPLADEQDVLAKAARALGDKAADAAAAAKRAADQLRAGSAEGGLKAGADAVAKLGEFAGAAGPDDAKKARDITDRQADLNDRLRKLAGQPAAEAARQARRQAELADDAGRVADALRKAGDDQLGQPGQDGLSKAAAAGKQAQEKMAQASRDAAGGRADAAANTRRQAAESASAAADAAAKAAPQASGQPSPDGPGGDLRQAGEQMRGAASQLGKGGTGGAMKQAADALGRASDKLGPGKGQGGTTPGGNDGSGTQPRTDGPLPGDVAKYLDKPWGDLPGDVRGRIIQDIAAKYGDDYARTIKLYFEQLATKK